MGIVICQWEYNTKNALHPNVYKDDYILRKTISDYYERVLLPLGIKDLKRKDNIIITDVLIYAAYFEEDLEKVEHLNKKKP